MHDFWFYAAAAIGAILVGLAKGGLAGLGLLAVPILSQVISPVHAAGLMLPVLLVSDAVAVYTYRRHFDASVLKLLIPAGIFGIGIGWATAAWVNDDAVRLIVGVIALSFSASFWLRKRGADTPAKPNRAKGFVWGSMAGLTSFIAHVGGPPFQVYVVPLRLDRLTFMGTGVIFFATMNVIKVVPFFFLGQLNRENLLLALMLLPLTIGATFVAVWIVRRLDEKMFYRLVNISIFLVGLKLTYDGLAKLI